MRTVIEVRLITACPVLIVVIFHHSSLTVSCTTKQHPPVMDAVDEDEDEVEVEDGYGYVVFEKKNLVAG